MKTLKVAKEISFPINVVTQTLATIGRKGSGKTYLATMIAEQMIDAEAQVVIIDPVGNWWGLRVDADGKKPGKDIFVIGGDHGDIPLVPEAGAKVARLIVEKNISAVLDVSGFRIGEHKRFAADFAEEFFHLKKSHKTPVHLFIEEAQKIIPQRVGPEEARMVGAFEQIVRLGRNYGIGCTLITQRPQSVNKEVLSQVECLCVLQVTGPHERKALEEWVYEAGADRKLVGELPGLEQGEGYVWSPSWLRKYERVHFLKKTTFDASATPEVGRAEKAASLSSVDVEMLKKDMAEVIAEAEKDDPKALRKIINQLQKDLLSRVPDNKPVDIEKALAPHITAITSEREATRKLIEEWEQYAKSVHDMVVEMEVTMSKRLRAIPMPSKKPGGAWVMPKVFQIERTKPPVKIAETAIFSKKNFYPELVEGKMGVGERKVLIASAQHEQVSREHLTVLTGYRRSSRDAYIQRLQAKGYISVANGLVRPTQEGIEALGGDYEPLPTGQELREHLMRTLPEGEKRVLAILIERYPEAVDREMISQETNYQRSSRDAYLQRLGARQLVSQEGRGLVKASEKLF